MPLVVDRCLVLAERLRSYGPGRDIEVTLPGALRPARITCCPLQCSEIAMPAPPSAAYGACMHLCVCCRHACGACKVPEPREGKVLRSSASSACITHMACRCRTRCRASRWTSS